MISKKTKASSRAYTNTALIWKMRLPLDHFVFFMLLNQQAKERVILLSGVIDIDQQLNEGGGLYLEPGYSLRWIFMLIVEVNRRWQFSHPPLPKHIQWWFRPFRQDGLPHHKKNNNKKTQPSEVLDEDKGNMKWVVKEGSCKHQLWPHDQLLAYYVYVCRYIIVYINYFIILSPSGFIGS